MISPPVLLTIRHAKALWVLVWTNSVYPQGFCPFRAVSKIRDDSCLMRFSCAGDVNAPIAGRAGRSLAGFQQPLERLAIRFYLLLQLFDSQTLGDVEKAAQLPLEILNHQRAAIL